MMFINENIYDMSLISKIKEQSSPNKLKKIIKNLRNIAEDDVKKSSGLKIKILEEKNEENKKLEFKNFAPSTEFQHYIEDFKKPNSRPILNNDEGENTPATDGDNEEFEYSDFSDDE